MINTLLIFKDKTLQLAAMKALQDYYQNQVKIEWMESLQDAIEHLEIDQAAFDLVVFEQKNPSLTMAKVLFPLCSGAKFIVCAEAPLDLSSVSSEHIVEQVAAAVLTEELTKTIKKFEVQGYLIPAAGIQEQYVAVKAEVMGSYCPLNYNVYIRVGEGRFVKLYHKGTPVERSDFDRYQKEKGVALFYFNKIEYQEVLEESVKRIEKLAHTIPLPEDLVVKEAEKAHSAVKDIITQIGFTPEAQMIARSSVAMTAKLIGSKPKLSKILDDLKKKDGAYVSSHSISVGTLACAIAHKLEWHSLATYFKLSLAAFMHDITLNDKLAEVNAFKDTIKNEFSSDEINKIKLHPVHAADYVRKMTEIPPDVDQIVFQHHERPDGSGFPRGLSGKFITPLSSVFIVAHELVEFMRTRESEGVETFLKENEELYHQGIFRKIWLALKSDNKEVIA